MYSWGEGKPLKAPTCPLLKHKHCFSGPCGFSYYFQMMMHNLELFFTHCCKHIFSVASSVPTQEYCHQGDTSSESDSFVQGHISNCFQRCVLITDAPINISVHIICFFSELLSKIISQVWDYAAKGQEHFYGAH